MMPCPCIGARNGLSCKRWVRTVLTNTDLLWILQKESSPSAYASWYPPVQQMLLCLSKLYRCVEARVFAGLAQDAVSSCTKAVQVSSRSCKPSGVNDCGSHLLPCAILLGHLLAQGIRSMHECISAA